MDREMSQGSMLMGMIGQICYYTAQAEGDLELALKDERTIKNALRITSVENFAAVMDYLSGFPENLSSLSDEKLKEMKCYIVKTLTNADYTVN